jgi:hypothetical protein
MQAQLEKLQTEAANCELIAKLATDPIKRETFAKLAEHFGVLAGEVQKAMARSSQGSF